MAAGLVMLGAMQAQAGPRTPAAVSKGGAPVATAEARPAAVPAVPMVLPFIEDNFAAARSQALRKGQLLVVDAWALWCHTCLSMRNYVFTDPLLREVADRFVYLSVDTEQPVSEAFVKRFPIKTWPTMLVIDPSNGSKGGAPAGAAAGAGEQDQVLARWTGAMTARELLGRLREVATQRAAQQGPMTQADKAALAGSWAEAAALYQKAGLVPGLRPQALLGQIQALREAGAKTACAELGDTAFADVGTSALATDFASYAADCLNTYPSVDIRQKLRSRLRTRLEKLVQDDKAELLVDDRSDGYGTLTELADALGDAPAGDRYAMARAQLLEGAAKVAPSPAAAATFDAHRLDAYRRLRRYAVAETMLLASRKALPGDYNPPARLARLYYEMGRLDAALVNINQAIALCNGPRRVGMYELRASILHGLGQTQGAVQSVHSALTLVQAQARPGAPPSAKVASLEKLLVALQSTLPPGSPAAPGSPGPGRAPAPSKHPGPPYQPGDAVATQLNEEPANPNPKPKRPSRDVAKRDSVQ